MTPVVRVKPGALFTVIAPGGFVILAAIEHAAWVCNTDLTITSACDGVHSGPNDPHHRGEAFDVRTHDLADPMKVLESLQLTLGPRFFAFIESPGTTNEHIHIQVRKGTTYP